MKPPVATYRIQLHKDFNLERLAAIIDYLHELGIDTIYASPITTAPEDSLHGYDVTDPHRLNPVIGTLEQWEAIAGTLQQKGMRWLQDIVPNHMSFSSANGWLMDVLERGRLSPYAGYFDIQWQHPGLGGRLMVPFLPAPVTECVKNGSVRLQVEADGVYVVCPGDRYPLSIGAYYLLFINMMARDTAMQLPPDITHLALVSMQERSREQWQQMKRDVFGRSLAVSHHRGQIESLIGLVNSRPGWLLEILNRQYYRLYAWQEVNKEINYRRFFTVSSLICLRMEDERVFEAYHAFLLQLYRQHLIQGLRVDHIDGLYAPGEYLQRLRALFGEACYIVVEKILAAEESLPAQWQVQGTSGYEWLAYVNQLFTDRAGLQQLGSFYRNLVPDQPGYREVVVQSKRWILETQMAGELDNLVRLFFELGLQDHNDKDRWRKALAAVLVHWPVYRIYPVVFALTAEEALLLQQTIAHAVKEQPGMEPELSYLNTLFGGRFSTTDMGRKILQFLKRMMQFTGPLMAKGVEDTAFYRYSALISHCEVGDSPATGGISIDAFHAWMQERLRSSPHALNTTSTHDTKRGEDGRMRLNVLTALAAEWEAAVKKWIQLNEPHKIKVNGRSAPGPNEEYFLYQSVLAGFPSNLESDEAFAGRLKAYMVKALREAKVNTHWDQPDESYETACCRFIDRILDPGHDFLAAFIPFAERVVKAATALSLGQVLIKLTAPGVPDIFQGGERWDLSYVDPDNRRPVDYAAAQQLLQELQQLAPHQVHPYLAAHHTEGAAKLYVTWKTLQCRKARPALFANGHYLPLTITGTHAPVLAFARSYGSEWAIVVVPLVHPLPHRESSFGVILPPEAPHNWQAVFAGQELAGPAGTTLPAGAAMQKFPVGLWVSAVD